MNFIHELQAYRNHVHLKPQALVLSFDPWVSNGALCGLFVYVPKARSRMLVQLLTWVSVRFDFRLADKDSTCFPNELGNADELLQPGKRSRLRAC